MVLGISVIVDFFVHRHAHVSWEGIREFFPAFGFVSCIVLVAVAHLVRLVFKRKETYYD